MGNQYHYIGCFVDRETLFRCVRTVSTGHLERLIEVPHITFMFEPDTADESLFGEKSVAAPSPISDTYVNKQVLFCVYPNDVEAKRSDAGAWVADRSVSTKDGRIVRLVREDGVVFVQDPDLAEGERADAEIKAVGNYFDKISEFKINC